MIEGKVAGENSTEQALAFRLPISGPTAPDAGWQRMIMAQQHYRSNPKTPKRKSRGAKATHGYTDKSRGVRLQKVLAEAGVDSRRHCEELIEDGLVKVNGEIVSTLPAWVDPLEDSITVNGKKIKRPHRQKSTGQTVHQYVLLNKPTQTVCTNHDPQGRRRAIDLVEIPGKPRLFCIGRLDADSTGLLLLTTDGDLAHKLTHPKFGVHKTYEVVVKGSLDAAEVAKLAHGIHLLDRRRGRAGKTAPVKLKLLKRDRERTHLIMELREGRNRQIRRMLANLEHPVKRLTRIQLGPVKLKGVAVGEWRLLTAAEKRALHHAADPKKTKTTGNESKPSIGKPGAH